MNIIIFHLIFFVVISKIKCQQVLNENLKISENRDGEKIDLKKTNIERRFLEDLDDYEWHVAHLRNAIFDGRKDCKTDTFADKVRRYRKMLKSDGARVEYVSADPLPVDPADIDEDSCKVEDTFVDDELEYFKHYTNESIKVTSASFATVSYTDLNIVPTTAADNLSTVTNTTVPMKIAETTPKVDFKATTVASKIKQLPKKKDKTENKTQARRASEYMFSSIEYYDESVEFNDHACPDAVEVIELEIDQLRSYDLECEKTVEWRSLE